jgi:hypothetical protein
MKHVLRSPILSCLLAAAFFGGNAAAQLITATPSAGARSAALYAEGVRILRAARDPAALQDGFQKLIAAANDNHADAANEVGRCLLNGLAVEKNLNDAVKWFQVASDRGSLRGTTNLGLCYQQGWGLQQNQAQAVALYTKSAKAGEPFGMLQLGCCYGSGIGVPQDQAVALEWFKRAADAGNTTAMQNLAVYNRNGFGGLRADEATAKAWTRKAAELGDASAKLELQHEAALVRFRDGMLREFEQQKQAAQQQIKTLAPNSAQRRAAVEELRNANTDIDEYRTADSSRLLIRLLQEFAVASISEASVQASADAKTEAGKNYLQGRDIRKAGWQADAAILDLKTVQVLQQRRHWVEQLIMQTDLSVTGRCARLIIDDASFAPQIKPYLERYAQPKN